MNFEAMNYEEWKTECALHAERIGVAGPDLWADDDPYDLSEAAESFWLSGASPQHFIDETFAEDIASREHDDLMEARGARSGAG